MKTLPVTPFSRTTTKPRNGRNKVPGRKNEESSKPRDLDRAGLLSNVGGAEHNTQQQVWTILVQLEPPHLQASSSIAMMEQQANVLICCVTTPALQARASFCFMAQFFLLWWSSLLIPSEKIPLMPSALSPSNKSIGFTKLLKQIQG